MGGGEKKVMVIRKGGFGRRSTSPFPLSHMIRHHLSIIWPDWRWSPSYILTLRKSLPVSLPSPCPTQSHFVSTENDSHTPSLLFLLDSAEPLPFPFVPHLYPAWETHRKKETILSPLIFTHFPKPTETFHTMSINWFRSDSAARYPSTSNLSCKLTHPQICLLHNERGSDLTSVQCWSRTRRLCSEGLWKIYFRICIQSGYQTYCFHRYTYPVLQNLYLGEASRHHYGVSMAPKFHVDLCLLHTCAMHLQAYAHIQMCTHIWV